MNDIYPLLLATHIGAATLWIGAAVMQALFGVRVVRAADPARTLTFARDAQWTGLHVYLPCNLLVPISGVLMIYSGHWSLSAFWLDLGLAGFAISFVTGAAALKPGWDAASRLSESEDRMLHRLVRRMVFVTHVDVGVLVGVMYVMTVKPAPNDALALGVGAAAVIAVLLMSRRVLRITPRPSGELQDAPVAP